MGKGLIDYGKYGFEPIFNTELKSVYEANISGTKIELEVSKNLHTLRIAGVHNIMVANRYEVNSDREFEWLLLRGRVGKIFSFQLNNDSV